MASEGSRIYEENDLLSEIPRHFPQVFSIIENTTIYFEDMDWGNRARIRVRFSLLHTLGLMRLLFAQWQQQPQFRLALAIPARNRDITYHF